MDHTVFSWQQNDFESLLKAYSHRIILIYSKDISSPYHVFTAFYDYLYNTGLSTFFVSKSNPALKSPLLPFLRAADGTTATSGIGTGVTKAFIKDITQSDTLAQIYENIMKPREAHSLYLSEHENELILRYGRVVGGNIPVFFFFGYPYFDSASKNLTELLVSGQLDQDYSFLSGAKYVFLCDTEDELTAYSNIIMYEHVDLTLSDPDVNNMEEILSEFSPSLRLQPEEQDKLFHLAGGRLSVIDLLARYLLENGATQIDRACQDAIDAALNDRLERLGQSGYEVKAVLETAAVIGNSFAISLLKRAVNQPETCEKILKKSDEEFLTNCTSTTGKFKYPEIWAYFLHFVSHENLQRISNTIADAIYFFNPYDYYSRAYYLEQADNSTEACELYFLAYNNFYQEGITPLEDLAEKLNELTQACGLSTVWTNLKKYYSLVQSLEFQRCLEVLEDMPILTTPRIRLLTEYLKGICMHRAGDTIEYQQTAMLAIEKAAEYARNLEDGVWCDCQMVLISFSVNITGDIMRARKISSELAYYYTSKGYSPFAKKGLHALERKHGALYSVEKAVVKTQRSVEYFRKSIYPSQYLMALNNHSANLIVLGSFSEARSYLAEALEFIAKSNRTTINSKYILNNYFLCGVLSGEITPHYAYGKMIQLLENEDFGDWQIILKLNSAIYLALGGHLKEAAKKLVKLEELSRELSDDYYLYYVYANLAAVHYLQGHADEAVSLLDKYCTQPPALFKETEKYYLRERTKEWITTMKRKKISNPCAFDTFLLKKHPEKTQWAFSGRGFLYSDIQFWSEP